MRGIPRALGCSTYLSVWREVGALCVERLAVFVPSLPTLCFPLCISVTGACFSRGRGGSWLGCQVLPAICAVSILELAANSGSSRMSRAPNLQGATKVFTEINNECKSSQMLVFDKRGNQSGVPGGNLSVQSREPTLVGGECSHHCTIPVPQSNKCKIVWH